ncbi:hypothetical protein BXZ70DRAFT_499395 [Cristinia sonorae]|uniref:DUF6534 domain-containing protein n=1 Tax=Cristinia sonorae TaxID=1940300 RepID=A0A8K0UGD0_9AGAR|nr:hypothetical protein BXZ70DRAFT_499395 [Cristinia sonorae]
MDPALPPPTTFMGKLILMIYATLPLYGIYLAQLFAYTLTFVGELRDSWYLRANVILLTILETFHTVVMIHFAYHYSITSASDPAMLFEITWSGPLITLCESVMVVIVHSFYIRRIYIMSKRNLWLVTFLVTLLIARSVVSVYVTAYLYLEENFISFHANSTVKLIVPISLSLLVVADFCVASTMVYYLYQGRSGTTRGDHLVNTLIIYIVNTGFITVIFSFAVVMSFVLQGQQLTFAGPLVIVTKLYANAVLGSLNMRTYLRDPFGMSSTEDISMMSFYKTQASRDSTMVQSTQLPAPEAYPHIPVAGFDEHGIPTGTSKIRS